MSEPEPSVSVDEVGLHLGISKETGFRGLAARGLPAHEVGRPWKFPLPDIDGWVRGGGAGDEPTGEPG